MAIEMYLMFQKMFKQKIQIHSTLSKTRHQLVARSTKRNLQDFKIDKNVLLICYNDETIKLLLCFLGADICSLFFKNMSNRS